MIRTIRSTATDRMINSAASDHNINSTCNENCSIINVIYITTVSDIANEAISVVVRSNSIGAC